MSKKAIVLLNLGGPSNLEEVKPFLFRLFYDKAIINLINPFRYMVAKFISSKREEKAKGIYSKIGGGSPILEQTLAQAANVEERINKISNESEYKVFVAMRYSFPGSNEAIGEILRGGYGEVILVPLYPQFSTTTTESSINDFVSKVPRFYTGKIKAICCYFKEESFIKSQKSIIIGALKSLKKKELRILFSAHSLPEKIIKKGDPYQWQIEQTCNSIMQDEALKGKDFTICYQSKVGSLKWIGPSTEDEIKRAAQDKKTVLVVPISFVSEHSETLVELDIDYRKLAKEQNIDFYRTPTLQIRADFIEGLVSVIEKISVMESGQRVKVYPADNKNVCEAGFCKCMLRSKFK